MGKTIIVDGHEYYEREDGLYQVDTPYEIDPNWLYNPEHKNMAVIAIVVDNKKYAIVLSLSTLEFSDINKINRVAANMRKDHDIVQVEWALNDDDDKFCIGGLYRDDEVE